MSEDAPVDVDKLLYAAAHEVHRRYRSFVDYEDLVQEGWLWTLANKARVTKLLSNDEPKIGYLQLKSEVSRAIEAYCRHEKSQRLGYEPDDEVFYSRKTVLSLLPFVFNNEYERQAEQAEVSAKTDPAHRGDFAAGVMDVSAAWDKAHLTAQERALLSDYTDGLSMRDLAEQLGVSLGTVSKRVNVALDKMVDFLGGHKPRCGGGEGCAGCLACTYGSRRPGVHSAQSGENQALR